MRYLALATDYDGTVAHHGAIDEPTIAALERLRQSGRRLILVTGRELDELLEVCPRIDLFDRVVAENGALLYDPADRSEHVLAESPPPEFARRLSARGAERVSSGRVIVATWEPHQTTALKVIHEMGLELQVIFNKGAVMILPSGVNKATGLAAALDSLGLSAHNTVGVGDAENDHAFLAVCELSAAVSNALPALKERADIVTRRDHGAGVAELIDGLLEDDLAGHAARLGRHDILLGERLDDGAAVALPPYGRSYLVAGTSGSGKSTLTTGLLERFAEKGYQFVILDPEGDYSALDFAVTLGDTQRAPVVDEVMALLEKPSQNVVVNLLGIALEHRPAFFAGLLPRLQELRTRTGRPHWIVVDEAHHLMPATWDPATMTLPQQGQGMLYITVHPESLAPGLFGSVDVLLGVGTEPARTAADYCRVVGCPAPDVAPTPLEPGEVLYLTRDGGAPARVRSKPPTAEHDRHNRKYAEGSVGPDRAFRFRGPEDRLDLRAQNLTIFLQMADGVDEATWLHHLRQGDYSRWFREIIKDRELAAEAEALESEADPDPAATRKAIRDAIERRYTLPADRPSGEVTTTK
jgi:HAD superfamily hydrolase (TIGR01484 family)